jgi:periplasmic protein TonB
MNRKKTFLLSRFISFFIAVILSFFLFLSIPLIRDITGYRHKYEKNVQERKIIAEYVRDIPQKKEVIRTESIKSITNAEPGHSGNSDNNMMSLKIAPDLAVEGSDGAGIAVKGIDMDAMVFDESQTDENVTPVFTPPVDYPQRARELGIQGTFEAVLTINRDGSVLKIDVSKTPHKSITDEALKVLKTWRFKPAKIKGIPVKVKRIQDIDFKLDQN